MLGDCLERMKDPDRSVDLTDTSPPYDNLRTDNDSLNDRNADKWQTILRELFRATSDGGVVVWVVADTTIKGLESGTSFRQALYAMECGFKLHDTMIYEKTQAFGGSKFSYLHSFEYMFVLSKGSPRTFHPIIDRQNIRWGKKESTAKSGMRPDGTIPSRTMRTASQFGKRKNIWHYGVGGSRTGHPAVPLKLAKNHIDSWSNEGDTVFDPFLGSGTTGVATLESGRRFVGIERDESYFKIENQRIASVQAIPCASAENDNNPMLDITSEAFRVWLTAV